MTKEDILRMMGVNRDRYIGCPEDLKTKRGLSNISIEKVIFNEPATIIYWSDGSRSVVRAQNGEPFDPEKGMAMAMLKRIRGNKGRYYEDIKKWTRTYYL